MSNEFGQIRQVTPSDEPLEPFKYIQAGGSGTIIIETAGPNSTQTTISAALIDKLAIVPVGVHSKVTGGTATDIYVWS